MDQKRRFSRKNKSMSLIVSSLNDSLKTTIEDTCVSLNMSEGNMLFLSKKRGMYSKNQRINLQLNMAPSRIYCSGRIIRVEDEMLIPRIAVEITDCRPKDRALLRKLM